MAESIALPHWTVATQLPSTGNEKLDRELRLFQQALQENFESIVSQTARQLEGAFQQRVPAGVVFATAVASPPTGYLAASGQAVSRSVFADLFAALGTSYGAGDGSTTFNLPNYNDGRFPRGNTVPGATGGANTHTHNVSTSVSVSVSGVTGFPNQPGVAAAAGTFGVAPADQLHTHNFSGSGSGTGSGTADSQSNVPLYRDMFFIIKT